MHQAHAGAFSMSFSVDRLCDCQVSGQAGPEIMLDWQIAGSHELISGCGCCTGSS